MGFRVIIIRSFRVHMVRWLVIFTSIVAIILGNIIYLAFSRNFTLPPGKMTDINHFITDNNEWMLLLVIIILLLFQQILFGLARRIRKPKGA